MNFKRKLFLFNSLLNNARNYRQIMEDSLGLSSLHPFLQNAPFLPFSEISVRPYLLNFLVNELIINKRKTILEFGSGLSTIVLGRVIKKMNIAASLYSVEHDKNWYEFILEQLEKEMLTKHVNLIYSPITNFKNATINTTWYDTNILTDKLKHKHDIDLIIIDGPPAYNDQNVFTRYAALPFALDKMAEHFAVFLDDATRKGEKFAVKSWEKEFNLKFDIYSNSIAVAYKGEHYISQPVRNIL